MHQFSFPICVYLLRNSASHTGSGVHLQPTVQSLRSFSNVFKLKPAQLALVVGDEPVLDAALSEQSVIGTTEAATSSSVTPRTPNPSIVVGALGYATRRCGFCQAYILCTSLTGTHLPQTC